MEVLTIKLLLFIKQMNDFMSSLGLFIMGLGALQIVVGFLLPVLLISGLITMVIGFMLIICFK